MPLSMIVNNVGVGKVEATALNLTTTVAAGSATPFTQALVDAFRRAGSLLGNNFVGQGTTTYNMYCSVLGVSETLTAKNFPETLAIQVSGYAEMQATTGDAAPVVNATRIAQQRSAFVVPESTPSATNAKSRGIITEVFDTDRVVVLF